MTAPVTAYHPTIAQPFTPVPPSKLEDIINKCVAHDPWFHDFLRDSGEEKKREAVIAYLADAFQHGKIWEVWKNNDILGILILNELVPFLDCKAHLIFFDAKLSDKVQLCKNLLAWSYENVPLEVIRIEVPTYARALLKFIRKLGFRFEGESRPFSWPQDAAPISADVAKLGSRKHRATLYKGVWHDVLLLSQTRDEFMASKENQHGRSEDNSPQ